MDQLNDLVDTLIATDRFPTAWAWNDPEDEDIYIDCSPSQAHKPTDSFTEFRMEVRDDEGNVALLKLDAEKLRAIHRQLTLQLAVITRQQQA